MTRLLESPQMYWARIALGSSLAGGQTVPDTQMYDMLELYYLNNGLYQAVQQALYEEGIWTYAMMGLRNPAHRVVEFYVSKLWPGKLPGALPIVMANKKAAKAIEQVWTWSNWGANKQVACRWLATYGDWFVKVATKAGADGGVEQVYLQQIKPTYVVDFEADHRGYLTMVRFDVPQEKVVEGVKVSTMLTEVWDKQTQAYQVWEHKREKGTALRELGQAKETRSFDEFGIDFVPVVHGKFVDVGDKRGLGAFTHALDKIDETNRMATRLHQMLFRYNKAVWALKANAVDGSGRPLPPPRLGTSDSQEIGDDELFKLPGNSSLEAMVPDIKYEAALAILQAQMQELEADLPEMAYYRLRELKGELSGRAVRMLLSDAVDRVLETRGNAETALARANAMALTIGQNLGLFSGLGSYEAGDFEHSFGERPVIELTDMEEAEAVRNETESGVPLVTSLRRHGWTEDELKQMAKDREAEKALEEANLGQAMLAAQRRFNAGEGDEPRNTRNTRTDAGDEPRNTRTDAGDQEGINA